jgi:hypothetical protein
MEKLEVDLGSFLHESNLSFNGPSSSSSTR